ncbi:sugar phosphate nucleotidyltransferase [Haloarcula salinisoli]|uniref:NDP-sugar synthase n=1 Tax=Haloarcula salinisoli TaxID=2487746 RepID=A0A8J8C6S6_9EURY|nr:NDP-sugar synthase [Halomicroarcula salinisoli]MBX0302547.1 NDP-sugar synthase [Halomicroarcula salinisoli]
MKAIVLAGGYATRMWPITRHRPKMLLPVGESTVIDGIVDELEGDERISEILISTNDAFADEFETHFEERGTDKISMSVEDTSDEDEKFGVVGALAQLVEREGLGDEDLLVIAGDNLFGFDISEFIDHFKSYDDPTLAAYDVGDLEKAKSYGLIQVEGDEIVDFQEKPDNPKSTLVSIACYAFPADAIRFDEYLAGDNNPDEPGWFIQWLVDQGSVRPFSFDDVWYDIGTADSYLEAVEFALEGGQIIADDATVENSKLGDNVHVLPGATIKNSSVENTVVFQDASITDADVSDSVIDEEASVHDKDLHGSLLGQNTRVQ